MTDDELQVMADRAEQATNDGEAHPMLVYQVTAEDVPALIAEVRRLRAGLEAMRLPHDEECISHYRGLENACTCDPEQRPLIINAQIDALLAGDT